VACVTAQVTLFVNEIACSDTIKSSDNTIYS